MIGYKGVPTSDPEEQRLRDDWYFQKENGTAQDFSIATQRLTKFLWDRVVKDIENDRAKHPKAKRNQVYEGPTGQNRNLP